MTVRIACLVTLATAGLAPALAQTPPPAAGPAPPYGPNITLAQAKTVLAAAEGEARKRNAAGAVFAIVQPNGALVLFEKLDGSTYVSIEFAQAKARTAAITRRATGGEPPGGPPLPDLIGLPGGVPIVIDAHTVGAIGVSGVEGADAAVAEAAAAAVKAGT
ncbi:MAG: heme-binding protein [Proteobacteria bacterium]|nr:heme-binding protein [Pseudomonadota bacterium]